MFKEGLGRWVKQAKMGQVQEILCLVSDKPPRQVSETSNSIALGLGFRLENRFLLLLFFFYIKATV